MVEGQDTRTTGLVTFVFVLSHTTLFGCIAYMCTSQDLVCVYVCVCVCVAIFLVCVCPLVSSRHFGV